MVSGSLQTCKVIIAILLCSILCSGIAWAEFHNVVPLTASNVIYLDNVNGVDTNDGLTQATEVKTLQRAYDLANVDAKSNIIFIQDSGVAYDVTQSITYNETTGVVDSPWLVGYETDVNDNGIAEIRCTTGLAAGMFDFSTNSDYCVFMNLSVSGVGVGKAFFDDGDSVYLFNCYIDFDDYRLFSGADFRAFGCFLRGTSVGSNHMIFDSYIEGVGNTVSLLSSNQSSVIVDSVIKGERYTIQGSCMFYNCTLISPAYSFTYNDGFCVFYNCIFYYDSALSDGIFKNELNVLMNETVIYYGGDGGESNLDNGAINPDESHIDVNLFNYENIGRINVNPNFNDATNNDYTPGRSMSGLGDSGHYNFDNSNAKDMGALQRKAKSSYVTFQ